MRYGLIGEKLGHSFSQTIHEQFGNPEYGILEIPRDRIEEYLREADFEGINVTIPYKETALRFCEPSETASAIGCVNTLVKKEGKVYGHNTDTHGFSYMLTRSGIDLGGKKVLILGSGGTSKTACYTALTKGASSVTVVSRSAKSYGIGTEGNLDFITYEELKDHRDAQILINTTPVGMFPDNDGMPADPAEFPNLSGVVDVVYNPLTTKLVRKAQKLGIPATNGLSMLVGQAWYAERLFFGRDTEPGEEDLKDLERVIHRVKMEKSSYILIGMPGCGKSTVGAMLSKKFDRDFIDTDVMFREENGVGAGEYIEEFGEEAFREKEAEVVRRAASRSGIVIATGGGAILREENVDALKSNGLLIYLHRELKDLASEGRPLSQNDEKRKALYYKRLPIYLKLQDMTVRVSDYENKTVTRVIKKITEVTEGTAEEKKRFLVINGPNLNMLGIREPGIYGTQTYADLINYIEKEARELDVKVNFYQSNHEGDLVDAIQSAYGMYDGIVINPGAYTHTSVAILDALKAVSIPAVEVHISDVDQRDDFRKISFLRQAVTETISGKGFAGYVEGIRRLLAIPSDL